MKQGVVMEIQSKDAFVFTNDCDLVKMPARKDMFVGQSIALPEPKVRVKTARRWLVPVLAAACIVLLACTGLLLYSFVLPQPGTVYLSLDINPSVEFTLNSDRVVTDVTPLNSDAWELLQKTTLIGLNYEDAIVEWIMTVREHRPEQFENLLISALLDRRDKAFADEIMALDGEQAARKLAALAGMDVKVMFTTDPAVREQAEANDLSIGRQMLLNLANEKHIDLSVDNVREGSLGALLKKLLDDQTTETIVETTETTSLETTVTETEPTETVGETVEETTVTVTETTKQPTETTKSTTAAGLTLGAASSGSGWNLEWTISPSGKSLAYYKVVISKSDSTPKYPDNGYLFAISNRSENACQVNNDYAYNGGDFDGYLMVGQKYYVCITYVFNDGTKQYSNVKLLTYNGPAHETPVTAAFSPTLEGYSDSSGLHLAWDISPTDRTLKYYKVVISKTDSTPQYSENGYLYAISSRTTTSCLADNESAYNGGDVGGYLTLGQKYYVAVTYVFSDCKITSNVLYLEYAGPEHITETTAAFNPVLEASSDAEGLHLSWTISPTDRTLNYYKVVISQSVSSPQYPVNGYLVYFTERATTYELVDNSIEYSGGDFGGFLVPGNPYYVAITYVFAEGDSVTTSAKTLVYQGPAGPSA